MATSHQRKLDRIRDRLGFVAVAVAAAAKEKKKDDDDDIKADGAARSVRTTLVMIPADESEDLVELSYGAPGGGDDDESSSSTVLATAQFDPYFALVVGEESVDAELIRKRVMPEYEKGCDGGMCPHVSFDTLRRHAEEGNVQTIDIDDDDDRDTIARGPGRKLRLFYDDSAALKGRPANARAASIIASVAASTTGTATAAAAAASPSSSRWSEHSD